MRLSDLRSPEGARHKTKRVGRGHGSGKVKTSGRGQKGQKARTGGQIPAWFEGGQNRFAQRMPYLGGFRNPRRKEYIIVNLRDLARFSAGEEVNGETLAAKGFIRPRHAKNLLKILGDGEIDRPLTFTAHKVSDGARRQIEAAGGTITLIPLKGAFKGKRKRQQSGEAATATGASAE